MTKEEKVAQFKKMLKNAPEIMTPIKVSRFSPLGRNHVYELIKSGELPVFVYRQTYIIAKDDLIEYLAEHCEDASRRNFSIPQGGTEK